MKRNRHDRSTIIAIDSDTIKCKIKKKCKMFK